jgi:uncharacterized protein YjbI with pentapeptide repeats
VDCNATPKPYVNLQGCNLAGRDFSGANLYGAKMQRTDLTGAVFHGADLTNANLSYSALTEAVFGYDYDYDPYLPQANLTSTNMSNTTGGQFSNIDATGVNLWGAVGVRFDFSTFDNVNLANAVVRSVSDQVSVSGDFSGADLSGIEIWKSSLSGNFTGANLTNVYVVWSDGDISGNFTNADLTGSNITGETDPPSIWSNTTCPNGVVQSTPC